MKKSFSVFLLLMMAVVITACSSATDAGTNNTEKNQEVAVDTIKVGTMGTYNPFSYVDENEKLTGYDLEVLRLLQKIDPSLKFEFIAGPWDSLFVGLDSGKFHMLANQITSNPDREANYYLSENRYFTTVSEMIVREGTTGIETLADLEGLKIGLTVGDSFTRVVEDWNKANGEILTLVYYEQGIETILQDLVSGRIDATVNDPIVARDKAKVQGLAIEVIGERIAEEATHFIFSRDEEGMLIRDKVDAALAKAIEDGSLVELSIDWFGEDYTK